MATSKSRGLVTASATLATLVAVGSLLGGCGSQQAKPMDDEFAGSGAEASSAPESGAGAVGEGNPTAVSRDGLPTAPADTGNYHDGTYALTGKYGRDGADSIDVDLDLSGGQVSRIQVQGHSDSPISRGHMERFARAVPGVVQGRPLKDLKVDKVAGASWTSDAFNKALDLARLEASADRSS